jgi:hypothetical protein
MQINDCRMQKTILKSLIVILLSLMPFAVHSADSLEQWTDISQPKTQQVILDRIFPGQIGSLSTSVPDPLGGGAYFSKGGQWVRLEPKVIYHTNKTSRYLVVTCTLYHKAGGEPVNTAAYLFRTTFDRPTPISAGYAAQEIVEQVELPQLRKSFVILVDFSPSADDRTEYSASVLDIPPSGRPKSVWLSPNGVWNFKFGFDALGGHEERLVLQTRARDGGLHYSAYRWNGRRFEPDSFVFENRLKALPDDVWKYGAGR